MAQKTFKIEKPTAQKMFKLEPLTFSAPKETRIRIEDPQTIDLPEYPPEWQQGPIPDVNEIRMEQAREFEYKPKGRQGRSQFLELWDAMARGLANVGSGLATGAAEGQKKSIEIALPEQPGYGVKSQAYEKVRSSAMERAEKLRQFGDLMYDVSRNPDLAAQNTDVFGKLVNLTGETIPYMTATTASSIVGGPLGGFAVGSMVEGNSAYRTALENDVPEDKAKLIGAGVGIVAGAIESLGFGVTKRMYGKIAESIGGRIGQGAAGLTAGALNEAMEEGLQEVTAITGEATYRDIDRKEAIVRTLTSMAAGGVLGGPMNLARGIATGQTTAPAFVENQETVQKERHKRMFGTEERPDEDVALFAKEVEEEGLEGKYPDQTEQTGNVELNVTEEGDHYFIEDIENFSKGNVRVEIEALQAKGKPIEAVVRSDKADAMVRLAGMAGFKEVGKTEQGGRRIRWEPAAQEGKMPSEASGGAEPSGGDIENPFVEIQPEAPSRAQLKFNALDSIYQDFINRFGPIEKLTKQAKKTSEIIPGEDPGILARGYLGLGRKIESVLRDKTYRITEGEIEITGEGLKPILDDYDKQLRPIEKKRDVRKKDLYAYLDAQRTILDLQRPAKGSEDNIATPKQVREALSSMMELREKYGDNIGGLDQAASRIHDFQRRVLHGLVDSGVMSQNTYDTIIEKNPHYIPFDRVLEDSGISGIVPRGKNRFTKAGSPLKYIKGSEREKQDFIGSMIKSTSRIMEVSERNNVSRSVAALSNVFPDTIRRIKRPASQNAQVIEYYENGQRKYMEVPKQLYNAMTGLNEEGAGLITKILSVPAHALRVGATITPEFMFRNPIRDQFTAMLQTQHGFIPGYDTIGAIADVMGKSDAYYDWIRSGGAYSGIVELNRPALNKLSKELTKSKTRKLFDKWNILADAEDISMLMEQATRVAVYKSAIASGMTPLEAGFQSREATIDFSRIGGKMKNANRAVAFLNAQIQGVDKTFRQAKTHPVSTTLKGAVAITLPSLLLYSLNRDDEAYKEIPRWQKDLFWILPYKYKGEPIRIPKPFLYGQLFGSLPERFFEYLDTKDPEAFRDFEKTLLESFTPIQGEPVGTILPTAIKPIVENWANRSLFLERPIVPYSKQDLLPGHQAGRYTSKTAKALGRELEYSPAKIENLVRGYFGGTGRYALEGSDYLINSLREARGEKVKTRDKTGSDIPLIKGFLVRNPMGPNAQSIQNFYEDSKELIAAHKTRQDIISNMELSPEEKGRLLVGLETRYPNWKLGPLLEKAKKGLSEMRDIPDETIRDKAILEIVKKWNERMKQTTAAGL